MKKFLLILVFLLLMAGTGNTQDYDIGIGIKVGMVPGISAKHFLTRYAAIEGIATYRWNGGNLTCLAEFHIPVFDTEGMYFYYGGGIHAGIWDSGIAKDGTATGHKLNLGIDGIVGLEYVFSDVPLSLGVDWKPNWNIITNSRLVIDEISLSLRYLFH